MRKALKKTWVPIALFVIATSFGVCVKKAASNQQPKITRGIVVDNQVTNHLWCAACTQKMVAESKIVLAGCGCPRKRQTPANQRPRPAAAKFGQYHRIETAVGQYHRIETADRQYHRIETAHGQYHRIETCTKQSAIFAKIAGLCQRIQSLLGC